MIFSTSHSISLSTSLGSLVGCPWLGWSETLYGSKKRDVEDGVNVPTWWDIEYILPISSFLQDFERAVQSWDEFLGWSLTLNLFCL